MQPAFLPRYEVREKLGEGGYGVVYRADDLEHGGQVALKLLKRVEPKAVHGFKREFRELRDLRHPNLVSLYELVQADDQWLFTMELVEGEDWLGHVQAAPADERPERIRKGLLQIVEGLGALHQHGRVHRDLKPSNVLVTRDGRVVLADFGLVARAHETSELDGTVVGSVGYMAPEQALGKPPTPEADLYALGALLYETLTGRLPFEGDTFSVLLRKGLEDPVPPRVLVPDVDRELEQLCLALMMRNPALRPSLATLRGLLGNAPTSSVMKLPSPTSERVFVGRAREQATLRAVYERACEGHLESLLVHGSSGIGKSALVQRFVSTLRERREQPLVLTSACRDHERVAFKAIDGLMEALARHLRRLPEPQRNDFAPWITPALMQLFPALTELFPQRKRPRAPFGIDFQSYRTLAFREAAALLARVSGDRPLVLVIEDMQWADEDSQELLSFLTKLRDEPAHAVQTMIVATGRVPDDAHWAHERIALSQLDEGESRELARALVHADTGRDTIEALVREGQGHPLFLQELCRLRDRPLTALTLEQVLGGRVEALDADGREVLELLAVAADALAIPVLQRSVSCSPERLRHLLFALREGRLLTARPWVSRDSSSPAVPRVEVTHMRLSDVLLARMGEDRKVHRHRELARALESAHEPDRLRIAHHHRAAGDSERARQLLHEEIAHARARNAHARSAAAHRELLDLSAHESADVRARLWRGLGEALSALGRAMDAVAAYQEALALGVSDAEELRVRSARHLLQAGHLDAGKKLIDDLMEDREMAPARSELRAFWNIAVNRLRVRRLRFQATPDVQRTHTAEELSRLELLWALGSSFSVMDQVRGFDYQLRHAVLAMRARESNNLLRALFSEVVLCTATDGLEHATADALVQRIERLAQGSGEPYARVVKLASEAVVAMTRARALACYESSKESVHILEQDCWDVALELGTMRVLLLWSCAMLARLSEQSTLFASYVEEARERRNLYAHTTLQAGGRMWTVMLDDRVDEARHDIEAACAAWPQAGVQLQHIFAFSSLAWLDMYERPGVAAFARAKEHERALERSMILRLPLHREHYMRTVAAAALSAWAAGDATARRPALSALSRLSRIASPGARPRHRALWAARALIEGDVEAAAASLRTAIDELEALTIVLEVPPLQEALGRLVGGDEGKALCAKARAQCTAVGIRAPQRYFDMVWPGFARL